MRPAALAPWLLAICAIGCTLQQRADLDAVTAENRCDVEGLRGGVCGEGICLEGRCHATSTTIGEVALQIVRSQLSSVSPGQEVFLPEVGTASNLLQLDLARVLVNLTLPQAANARVAVTVGSGQTSRGCFWKNVAAADGTLALRATLLPVDRGTGAPLRTHAARAREPNNVRPPLRWQADLSLPAATYDVYVEPEGTEACPVPPLLLPSTRFSDTTLTVVNVELSSPTPLSGVVRAAFDLTGWRAAIVDRTTGLTLSLEGSMRPAGAGAYRFGIPYIEAPDTTEKIAPLEYFPVGSDPARSPYLRLSPPRGVVAPSFAWEVAVIDIDGSHTVDLSLGDFSPTPVDVSLQLEGPDRAPLQGGVLLQATIPDGKTSALDRAPSGVYSFFSAEAYSDPRGVVTVPLLPGSYQQVGVATPSPDFALVRASRSFSRPDTGSAIAGPLVSFAPKPTKTFRLFGGTGDTLATRVPVDLTPAPPARSSLDDLFTTTPALPRPESSVTADDGTVSLPYDQGLHDLRARFPASSGFPWLVKPRIDPADPGTDLRVPLPIVVAGQVFEQVIQSTGAGGGAATLGNPIEGGLIRAYVVSTVAQQRFYTLVAEAPIDSRGAFELLLPSRD